MTFALEVDSLVKSYGRHRAVDGLSFRVRRGELACLIGPNGAGKSTTMRTIAGLQLRDEGRVVVSGREIRTAGEAKQACTLTPQDLDLFEYLTGEETLRMTGSLRGVSGPLLDERVAHWLGVTGLVGARGRLVREYSGGMKRKLAVASALVSEPALVLLDESFTGLDPESTRALQAELRAYCDRGGAVLLSSHILDMVHAIADRVVVVADGTCVADLDRGGLSDVIPARYPDLTELYLELTGARVST